MQDPRLPKVLAESNETGQTHTHTHTYKEHIPLRLCFSHVMRSNALSLPFALGAAYAAKFAVG
jgi:hypothetical protein